MGKPAEMAVVGSRSFRLLFELYYESVLNQQKEMTKKEKNKYYVGGSSSRCCRVSIASHTRRFNFSHFHPPCLLIYTKQRNKSRKDSINVKKKKIEKTIRQTYNIHPQMGIPPLTTAVHCVCDSFQFGFFLERRGRPIGRNGGLRQRQPCHRSGRQRSARLPSSGLKKKQFPKLRQVIKFFSFSVSRFTPGKPSAGLLRQDLPFGYRLSRWQNRARLLLQRVYTTSYNVVC
jgi:hypothetical protein